MTPPVPETVSIKDDFDAFLGQGSWPPAWLCGKKLLPLNAEFGGFDVSGRQAAAKSGGGREPAVKTMVVDQSDCPLKPG